MDIEDRRMFERIPVNLPVKLLDSSSSKESSARTVNISANGIGLSADTELNESAQVEIWITFPDKCEPLHTKGRIVWKQREQTGSTGGVELAKLDLLGISKVLRSYA